MADDVERIASEMMVPGDLLDASMLLEFRRRAKSMGSSTRMVANYAGVGPRF
ncbi:MAG TPA: hypothetical protein VMU69_20825 [Bradyrhizobium sp.]|nr:hypothetical protein [Stellaceae bacterium]HUN98665.1 hypothetical protein [Bradyrhizobium sp.]